MRMRKASQKEKIFQCFYDPEEPGIYSVNVEWSGVHVSGSPFTVLLAYTQDDLRRMKDDVDDGNIILARHSALAPHHHSLPRPGSGLAASRSGSKHGSSRHGSRRGSGTLTYDRNHGTDVLF